jgi:soluble P-type ATPase
MIEVDVPGYRMFRLRHLVLDVNGTLALDGALLPGVAERLAALKDELDVHLVTADTHGRQKEMDRQLDLVAVILPPSSPARSQREAKAAFVRELGAEGVVAMGNGNNDAGMVEAAGLGIAVLGPEGLATWTLTAADVVCGSINEGLDLLLYPDRLRATLRV